MTKTPRMKEQLRGITMGSFFEMEIFFKDKIFFPLSWHTIGAMNTEKGGICWCMHSFKMAFILMSFQTMSEKWNQVVSSLLTHWGSASRCIFLQFPFGVIVPQAHQLGSNAYFYSYPFWKPQVMNWKQRSWFFKRLLVNINCHSLTRCSESCQILKWAPPCDVQPGLQPQHSSVDWRT